MYLLTLGSRLKISVPEKKKFVSQNLRYESVSNDLNLLLRQQPTVLVLSRIQNHEEEDKHAEVPVTRVARSKEEKPIHTKISSLIRQSHLTFFPVFGTAQNSQLFCKSLLTVFCISHLILYPVLFIAKLYLKEQEITSALSIKGSGIGGNI